MALADFAHQTIAVRLWFVKKEMTQFRNTAVRDINLRIAIGGDTMDRFVTSVDSAAH
jgi:hypothetical protein